MLSLPLATLLLSLATTFIQAAPAQEDVTDGTMVTPNLTSLVKRATSVPLTAAQVASYKPYTRYAAVPGPGIISWNCGRRTFPAFHGLLILIS